MQLIFSVCMLLVALYELLQTCIWCDSWSCSCLVCTPHLLQWEMNVRCLWGALPSMQEHWVISPNSAFPEMLTCPPFTLPRWHFSPQADVGMWQKCVLRFVWWGCSASNVNCMSLQEQDCSVQHSHASESFQDCLHFLPLPVCLTLHSFKATFLFLQGISFLLKFCLCFLQAWRSTHSGVPRIPVWLGDNERSCHLIFMLFYFQVTQQLLQSLTSSAKGSSSPFHAFLNLTKFSPHV